MPNFGDALLGRQTLWAFRNQARNRRRAMRRSNRRLVMIRRAISFKARSIGLSIGIFAIAAGLAGVKPVTARPLDEVKMAGTLRVALYRDNAPFSARPNGALVGVDVDLAKVVADRLGVSIEFMELAPGDTVEDDLRNAVWKGSYFGGGVADVMMHVPVDRQFARRNDNVVIFGAYQRETFALGLDPRQIDPDRVNGKTEKGTKSSEWLAALAGHRIGVENGTLPDYFLMGTEGGRLGNDVVHFVTVNKALAALRRGAVAGVLAPRSAIEGDLGPNRAAYAITAISMPGVQLQSWDIGMAVKENSRDLAVAVGDILAGLMKEGTVNGIFAGYGLTYNPPLEEE
jgi:polar amino acid transport system substrate-binding protein